MKVVFLDFDGVLNTENYQAKLRQEGKPQWDNFGQIFDPEAVENLKMILDTVPDAIIVINSSWKLEGMDAVNAMWKARHLPGKIHGATPDDVPDLTSIDLEDYDNIAMLASKGNEVKQWMEQNAPQGCTYVILDDMPDFLPEQEEHLICTDPSVGITMENAIEAISLLNR